ncbi:MAG: ketoacyl-ACP synthase III [Alphaproteobacteria bacterium]|nr:ketoacyl-ACP synthase III [Alphaproteobacteria bacterium]
MKNSIGIAAIASYFPARKLGNREIVTRFGFELDFLEKKLGILERPIAAADEAVSDMAVAAGDALFRQVGVRRDQIGLLVVCTQNPDYRLPATANLVQHRLGLSTEIAAFDINQGCSGYIYGLSVAEGMMRAQGIDTALLITSEAYSKVMDPNDRTTVPLFGDAAAATLLRAGGFGQIGRFSFGSDGSGANDLIVRAGGSRAPAMKIEGSGALSMNGRAIYTFMMRRVPASVRECLVRNGLTLDDIDHFVFHQASRYMVEALAVTMKLDPKRVVIAMENCGNTVSSTIPIALTTLGLGSEMNDKRALLCGFGVGLSWAATVLHFGEA